MEALAKSNISRVVYQRSSTSLKLCKMIPALKEQLRTWQRREFLDLPLLQMQLRGVSVLCDNISNAHSARYMLPVLAYGTQD